MCCPPMCVNVRWLYLLLSFYPLLLLTLICSLAFILAELSVSRVNIFSTVYLNTGNKSGGFFGFDLSTRRSLHWTDKGNGHLFIQLAAGWWHGSEHGSAKRYRQYLTHGSLDRSVDCGGLLLRCVVSGVCEIYDIRIGLSNWHPVKYWVVKLMV